MHLRFAVQCLCVISLALLCTSVSAQEKQLRAGAAMSNIDPWLGLEMDGNMHSQRATNIHDSVHARALVLDSGENKLAIVIVDSCLILRETFDEAKETVHKKTGFPKESILMAATHTHSAPSAVGIFQSKADPIYQKFLATRMGDAVLLAMNNLQPAKIGWASGIETNQVFNRRWKMKPGVKNINPFGGEDAVRMNPGNANPDLLEPAGPTDPEVSVVSIQSTNGRPIALLANYSLHYCGNTGAGTVSADYFGAFCEKMEELVGAKREHPGFVAMLSNGTSGDCNNINFREPYKPEPPYVQINRVADAVAKVAYEAYRNTKFQTWVPLKSVQKEITLGVRLPAKEEVEAARAALPKAERINGQLRHRDDIYRRETLLMADYPSQTNIVIQAHRIGDLGIAAIPCEVFAQIGLDIKKQSPLKPTFTIELANGYNGYLPTLEQHKLSGYETWRARSSYLAVDSESKVVATVLELLNGVTDKPKP